MVFLVGCEQPQTNAPNEHASVQGIKLSDLQPSENIAFSKPEISFTVLTYELDSASMTQLSKVYRVLSKWGIEYEDKTAFDANGFTVGVGMPQKGSQVAKLLTDIGARRIAQARLSVPSQSHEVLTSAAVSSQSLLFPKSHRTLGSARIQSGKIGWIISAQKDSVRESILSVTTQPAFWEPNMADLRLLEGQAPFQYQTFSVGRFQIELREGQFFVLGPSGTILNQQTLSRLLFSTAEGEKGRLLVVIVEKAGRS